MIDSVLQLESNAVLLWYESFIGLLEIYGWLGLLGEGIVVVVVVLEVVVEVVGPRRIIQVGSWKYVEVVRTGLTKQKILIHGDRA